MNYKFTNQVNFEMDSLGVWADILKTTADNLELTFHSLEVSLRTTRFNIKKFYMVFALL